MFIFLFVVDSIDRGALKDGCEDNCDTHGCDECDCCKADYSDVREHA